MIMPHTLFMWMVVTGTVVGFCVGGGIRDVYLLRKHLPRRARAASADPAARRDQLFASVIGLLLVAVGVIGAVRYHW